MKVGRVVDSADNQWVVVIRDEKLIPVAAGSPLGALEVIDQGLTDEISAPLGFDEVTYLPPIEPVSLRDFTSFEGHLQTVYGGWGRPVPEEWYRRPSFYTGNANAVSGHKAEIAMPDGSEELDYEVEIACVIGTECINLDAADPRSLDVIAGFTIFNDWSARDLQRHDSAAGVGPGKGKDFDNSLGPFLVTPDEIAGFPESPSGRIVVTVNGEEQATCEQSDMSWSWGALLAVASSNTTLYPGDVIAAGTCTNGCILEHRALGRGTAWLSVGDRVEIEADGIGTLANTVVASRGRSVMSTAGALPGWRGGSR